MATRKPSEISAVGMKWVLKDTVDRIAKGTLQRGIAINCYYRSGGRRSGTDKA